MIAFIKYGEIGCQGSLESLINNSRLDVKCFDLSSGQNLPAITDCQGVIYLGQSIDPLLIQTDSFFDSQKKFVKQVLEDEIPYLGLSFGAQILAGCQSETVSDNKKVSGLGWNMFFLSPEATADSLLNKFRTKFEVFENNEYRLTLPEGAVSLVNDKAGEPKGFRLGNTAWGFICRFDVFSKYLKELYAKGAASETGDGFLYQYFTLQDLYLKQARILAANFSDIVSQYRLNQTIVR